MEIGYTKAYRKELNSDIWKMPPLYQRVFYCLRQKAAWKSETFPTRKIFNIALNPGQLITSLSIISEDVSWYEYGVKKVPNKKTIKDILGWLESNAMVTTFSNRHGTFITITNWDTYNNIDDEKVTQNNQQFETLEKRSLDTLKEVKRSLKKERKKTLSIPYEKIEKLFNEILPELPQIQIMTEERQKTLKARWNTSNKTKELEWWEKFFNFIHESPFLMGQGKTQFRCSFDWIIKKANFVKILEGNYHHKN